ncbi:MAG TPA: HD-GYP domain-containing protein [Bacillales bacterium]|nr:HD-GYP domain-containing protein [Bacillales bacterium]
MKVKRLALKPGDVLDEDVYVGTAQPIMRRKTKLSAEHLQVLEAFFVREVMINKRPVEEVEKRKNASEKVEDVTTYSPFIDQYLSSVAQYKLCFQRWQSGQKVDIQRIRNVLIPLLEKAAEAEREVFHLHLFNKRADYLYHHAVSTGVLAAYLAKRLGYSKGDLLQVGLAGALSDCGMARVSLSFLKNKGKPSPGEREQIRQHPVYSYHMIKAIPALKEGVSLAVSQHHERENGSGYPLGISGRQIHPFGKIVAVADSYHAMTCERAYREKRSPFQVLEVMTKEEFGQYDLRVLQELSKALLTYSVGTKVRLTDQRFGEIAFIPPRNPTRPFVRLEDSGELLSLAEHPDLSIETLLT